MSGQNILTETAHSLREFNELVAKLERFLSNGEESANEQDKFWYRGVNNGSYTLTPSLYRYRNPIEKEQLLFNLHGKSAIERLGGKLVSWERVIHMQHYNIPTRLLDWTANKWIAVFFALTSAPIQPCVYILNPLRLNRKGNQVGLPRVPMDNNFDFEEHFLGNPVLAAHYPLAVIPTVPNDRSTRQTSRFTIQGRDPEALERQAPECLARVNLHESSYAELRREVARVGIDWSNIFPDHEGVAQFVKSEGRLEPIPYDENIASRIRKHLQDRARHDLHVLRHRDEGKEPYGKGIGFCNIDEAYLHRSAEAAKMVTWLKEGPPFVFITGKAGVGKTNFALHTLLCEDCFQEQPSVFFSFKLYGSRPSRVDRNDGAGELANHLYEITLGHKYSEQERHVARQMISEGDVVLVLDGLDELARIRGVEAVEEVGRELDGLFGGSPKARVVITCRDHILARLRGTGALGNARNQLELQLDKFPAKIVRNALRTKIYKVPEELVRMACVPLFYEMIRRTPDHWQELLKAEDN
ncbi:MAG: FRG domain-containing protein [Desulfobacteraceae bacterium]|nr:MAG: FRG domain-containing protein [Desulfobacteraceae bacterium]